MHIRWAAMAATTVLAAGALTLPAMAPATAAAPGGTIVFVRDANIWLVRADGSGLHQVTRDGVPAHPYVSPTMSDGGTIAVGKGDEILRMQQNGNVLNRLHPPAMLNSVGQPVDGPPVDVAISPDGTRIAYTMVGFSCPIAVSCGARAVTGVTAADRFTGPTMRSYDRQPSWVSNTRLMVHGGYGSHVKLQEATGDARHWFDDGDIYADSTDLGDASLSRDGTRLVALRGYSDTTRMAWYAVTGDPRTGDAATLPDPTTQCTGAPGAGATDPNLHEPNWSPDGTAFVVGATEGIWVVAPAGTCETTGLSLLGAGSDPSWSAAAINPPATPPTNSPPSAAPALQMTARPHIKGQARVGKRLVATPGRWSPKPTTVRYTWLRNGKRIKKATKKAYRVVRRDRGKKVSVRVKVSRKGFKPRSATSRPVRVR